MSWFRGGMLVVLLATALAATGGARGGAEGSSISLDQLIQIEDARYDSLSTLRAHFTEIYTGGGTRREESGELYLRKPGKMLWQYQAPQAKVFLVDGHKVWLYVRGDAEAQVRSLKDESDLRTPLRWLLGKMDLKRELAGISFGGLEPLTPGDWVLRGTPRFLTRQFREVLLEISPAYNIVRIVIRTVDGEQTDFRLSDIEANHPLPASLFRFTPPPGVKVVPAPA